MYRYLFIIFVLVFFNCSDNKNNFPTIKKNVDGIAKKVEILREMGNQSYIRRKSK